MSLSNAYEKKYNSKVDVKCNRVKAREAKIRFALNRPIIIFSLPALAHTSHYRGITTVGYETTYPAFIRYKTYSITMA